MPPRLWPGAGRVGDWRVSVTEDRVAAAIGDIHRAGFGETSWLEALRSLADVTGSMGAQLVGFGTHAAIPFNWIHGLPPEAAEEFAASGGGDPSVNSRVRIGMSAAELEVLDETAFTSAEDARRFPEYGRWLERYDLAAGCLSPLLRRDGLLIGAALMRNSVQGNVTSEQKRAFAVLGRHLQSAVRTRMAVGEHGWQVASGVLDALSLVAFICAPDGRILARTTSGDDFLATDDRLGARQGVLAPVRERDAIALRAAIAVACAPRLAVSGETRSVVLRTREGDAPLLVEVATAPAIYALGHGMAALVIVRTVDGDRARRSERLRDLFSLTRAEAEVASRLAEGLGPQAIAETFGVAIGTVRTHIRVIYEKCEVRGQVELVALLSRL